MWTFETVGFALGFACTFEAVAILATGCSHMLGALTTGRADVIVPAQRFFIDLERSFAALSNAIADAIRPFAGKRPVAIDQGVQCQFVNPFDDNKRPAIHF